MKSSIQSVAICTSSSQVLKASKKGQAWKAYLKFVGTNHDNESGKSKKFWEITGRGHGAVTVRWGRLGCGGRSQTVPFNEAVDRLHQKSCKGYQFKSA